MLLVLEKFFDTKVAAPPYRPNHLTTFTRILLCPIDPLKDIVSILRLVNLWPIACKLQWMTEYQTSVYQTVSNSERMEVQNLAKQL